MKRKIIERNFGIEAFSTAFRYTWASDFEFKGESHEMWEIVYVNGGEVEVMENEKIYLMKKNEIIIHAPWEFHRIKSSGNTSPEVYIASFFAYGELPEKLKDGAFTLNAEKSEQYVSVFDKISVFLKETDSSAYVGQEAADSLSAFLITLTYEPTNICLDTSLSANEYRKLTVAMSESVCDNKTVSDFARECGDSVSYVKQIFAKYAGISPKSYYNQLRIRHATKLLDDGKSVADVAYEMNFSSSNYFSSFYKRYTGVYPSSIKN